MKGKIKQKYEIGRMQRQFQSDIPSPGFRQQKNTLLGRKVVIQKTESSLN
jgi:hypothetical protein